MKILRKIDKYFWACLMGAILAGFLFPKFLQPFEGYVIYIIMTILFLLFVKVDVADILGHIKQPMVVIYVTAINMLVIPLLIYFIFRPLDPELTMGLLLLSALPSGVSAAAFTDIMEGKTSLTLTIIILSTLVAPFTIPLLFLGLYQTSMELDYSGLFFNLLMVIVIPLIISQVVERIFLEQIKKTHDLINGVIVFLLSVMIAVVIALQAEYIANNFSEIIYVLGILYVAFFVFQLVGYFTCFWLKKGEKVAISNSKTIMNNILGIVLALAFFGPKVELIVILSVIPWNTMIIVFHWYKKYLP